MGSDERQLNELLALVEADVDLERCRQVDDRYRRSLAYEEVDYPPLVCQPAFGRRWELPAPWDGFKHYTYREAFDDPAAMMQNMLLDRVVPGLLLEDDNPLAIRNDHGTIQIASILGGAWQMHETDYPWVKSLGSTDAVRALVAEDRALDSGSGVIPHSLRTLEYYSATLARYPACRQAIQVSLPDLQGPMDTADILWGSDLFLMCLEEPDLVIALMDKVVRTMLTVIGLYRAFASDRLDPEANTQHGYVIPGRLLIRDDSAIMVSPETYRDVVAPRDARLLREVGTGSIHFCGNGQHLIEPMLEIPDLRGIDLGQSDLMDSKQIYELAAPRKVALTYLAPARDDLVNGRAAADFPTGVVFCFHTTDLADAAEVVAAYRNGSLGS